MADNVEITITADDQTGPGLASASRAADKLKKSTFDLKSTLLALAPAAVPVVAAIVPMAAATAAAGVGIAAFGAAVMPQIATMSAGATAQKKLADAVAQYGPASKQAVSAGLAMQSTFSAMPPATQRATAALSVFKKGFADWSDGLAQFTMVPIERGMGVLSAVLPKLSPLVESTSLQLSRLVTVAGGAVASPGFDALADKFSTYTDGVLKKATDGVIHFARVLSEGDAHGPISEFMAYAREQGPMVKETLGHLAEAVVHLLQASADAGPGLLSLVDAAAKLVAAIPVGALTGMLQLAAALKLLSLASAGVGAASTGVQAFATRIGALQAASVAAGGGMAGLRAAFMSLGVAARASVVVAGIAAVAVAFTQLGDIGRDTPPNVDKLTTSLGELGRTGRASGEAARLFGADLGKLYESVRSVSDPSTVDKVQQALVKVFSLGFADSTPVKEAKEKLDGIDDGLTALVKGGKADVAAAAFTRLQDSYVKSGHGAAEFATKMDGYNSALADQAFEAQLTADAQGLFGQQALETGRALDAQKASADGLRGAIQALNDTNRSALGGMIGFEAAIDVAAEAAKKNAGALHMTDGALDLNSEKARTAASALSDLAAKTDSAAGSARDSKAPWSQVMAIYDRGRSKLISTAEAMGLTHDQAVRLASQILKTPDKTARLKGNLQDLQAKVDAAKAKLKTVPASKQASIRAEIRDLEAKVAKAKADLNALDGKTATTHVVTFYDSHINPAANSPFAAPKATGGIVGGSTAATGGARGGMVLVGEQGPEYVRLPYGSSVIPAGTTRNMRKGEKDARAGAYGDLTLSHFGKMAGYQRDEFRSALGKPSDVGSLVGDLNKWASVIKASTHGRTESRLLKDLDVAGRALIKNERLQEKVNAALDKAKDKLSSLKDSFAQLKDSVSSGIVAFGNITRGAGGEGRMSVASIRDSMTESRDKASSFAKALASLKKKGLSKDLLSQIASAGIEGGGLETASALLGGSKSDIAGLNKLQSQLKTSADAAGKTTADAMYGAGIKAAEGVVKGLTKNKTAIEKAMDGIAKALEAAIKKGLGVKGRAHGGIIGAAGGGPRSALTLVGEMGPELVTLPYGSTVHTAGDSRRMATGGGGGGQLHITLTIGNQALGELVIDPLRKAITTRGGNVQAVLGRTG